MFTRRNAMQGAALIAVAAGVGAPLRAMADSASAAPSLRLTLPEIAEDGALVPVEIEAEGARELLLVAPANPEPEVIHAGFGPFSPRARISTRIRLAESQEVRAYARMADGSLIEARAQVAVLAGGCVG